MPSLPSRRWQSPAAALATDVARCAALVVFGDRERGEVAGRAGPFERDEHVGELVLRRLERTDRHAELHAFLGVVDRHVEDRLRGADHLERERHRRLLHRAAGARPPPVAPVPRTRSAATTVPSKRTCASCRLKSNGMTGASSTASDRDDHRADAVVAGRAGVARDDDELVDCVAFDHEALLAARARSRRRGDRGSRWCRTGRTSRRLRRSPGCRRARRRRPRRASARAARRCRTPAPRGRTG